MAFRCDNCQYIYREKKTVCPFCGGRIYEDFNTYNALLNAGYTWAPLPAGQNDNPFESLQRDFFNEHQGQSTFKQENISSTSHHAPVNTTETPSSKQYDYDFFSELESEPTLDDDIPTVEPQTTEEQFDTAFDSEAYEQELQEFERERRREERQYRRQEFFNSLSNIRWQTVFRILLIIAVIVAVITIWNMREVIFSSILSFIFSLIPIIAIVCIVVFIIRLMFK